MMLNTQYNTPNVGLFKLFLLTHFVPCMQAQGKGRSAFCPKGFYIFTIFGRMPGFESKMLRMQPGVLSSLVVQFSQILSRTGMIKNFFLWFVRFFQMFEARDNVGVDTYFSAQARCSVSVTISMPRSSAGTKVGRERPVGEGGEWAFQFMNSYF